MLQELESSIQRTVSEYLFPASKPSRFSTMALCSSFCTDWVSSMITMCWGAICKREFGNQSLNSYCSTLLQFCSIPCKATSAPTEEVRSTLRAAAFICTESLYLPEAHQTGLLERGGTLVYQLTPAWRKHGGDSSRWPINISGPYQHRPCACTKRIFRDS